MHAGAPHPPALEKVIVLAHKWGVPPAAIAHRLHKLGLLSEWQYRKIREQITEHGAAGEGTPVGARRETSSLLQQVFASLHDRGITKYKIAGSLHLYLDGCG
jgi:Zn-dependent peptidase ImmA (M78 family)